MFVEAIMKLMDLEPSGSPTDSSEVYKGSLVWVLLKE
jgi:hypothetical protein